MSLNIKKYEQFVEPSLCFTSSDLEGVFPHEDNPIVISVITVGRNVHKVLINQGSLTDVMFWGTFINLHMSPDQLRPYGSCLVGFACDQVEVRGYVELRTTFFDESTAKTITMKYFGFNTPSAYNLLLGRPSLKRLGMVASSCDPKNMIWI